MSVAEGAKTNWRELALELANVSAELVTVTEAAAAGGWRVDPLVRGMLTSNTTGVSEVVARVLEAAGVQREGVAHGCRK